MTRKLLDDVAPTRGRHRAVASSPDADRAPDADQAAHERIIAAQVKTKVWLELDADS